MAVDLDTGHVQVLRLISANDVGRAVNPQQVEGQIEGAVAQSMGWALLEKYVQREGRAVTQHFSTYLIPGVLDVPAVVEPIILEFPDPQGPLGIRGMAEMPFIPTAPAIAAPLPAAGSTNCPTRRSGCGPRSTQHHTTNKIGSGDSPLATRPSPHFQNRKLRNKK